MKNCLMENLNFKAIPTRYSEHLFRSRLEARWAVFFDQIGLKWIYEMEGYELQNGQKYLPDFYFPELLCFGEVKPNGEINGNELSKLVEIGKLHQIILLPGLPCNYPKRMFSPIPEEKDSFVMFYNNDGYWRFWWTSKDQDDNIEHFVNASIKAKEAQFEFA